MKISYSLRAIFFEQCEQSFSRKTDAREAVACSKILEARLRIVQVHLLNC